MLQQHDITIGQYRERTRAPMPKPQNVHLSGVMGQAPYFGEYVKAQLITPARREAVFGGGCACDTTIDLRLQKLARDAIDKWLPSPDRAAGGARRDQPVNRRGARDVRRPQLPREPVQPRGAGRAPARLVVQAVRARDGAEGGHLAALDVRVEARLDLPRRTSTGTCTTSRASISGRSTSSKATSASDNSVFAQLTKVVGPANVARTAHELGITSHLDGVFSIGLGTQAVNPLEMARAYATFANGGYNVSGKVFANEPRAITTIKDVTATSSTTTRRRASA